MTFLSIVAGFLLWIVFELVGMALAPVLRPILRPIGRAFGRLLSPWTLAFLWIGALASYGFLPYSIDTSAPGVRALGFVAFMGFTPLALMGTFSLRRRRAEQVRLAALQPRPEPAWDPNSRVVRRSMESADAG